MEIVLPPDLAESLMRITRERRVDAALPIMIKEYLELKIADIQRRIDEYEEKYDMDFEGFKEACRCGEVEAHSYQVDEDFRELMSALFHSLNQSWLPSAFQGPLEFVVIF